MKIRKPFAVQLLIFAILFCTTSLLYPSNNEFQNFNLKNSNSGDTTSTFNHNNVFPTSLLENSFPEKPITLDSLNKHTRYYTNKDWATLIDSVWGPGLPTAQKLAIFDTAFNQIDHWYGAYMNLNINIDSLRNIYRPEIASGVSRGRFAAIMNYFSLALKDAHTLIMDIPVNKATYPQPGIPLFVLGTWRNNFYFGANLTPLPDSSLLVYCALPNHTLGLTAGDIVLGYDGVPWKILYKELLDAQLPILPTWIWGSTDESMTHIFLQSAGLNWHLFDTIDIIKHNSGDTVHLPTSLLAAQSGDLWGNEQLPVPGVPMPDVFNNDFVSWGIIDGTNIGYIYVASWDPDPQFQISWQFHDAIDSLMYKYNTDGLIIDFRLNYGGWMPVAHLGYSLLFNSYLTKVSFDVRGDSTDHFYMIPHPYFTANLFTIPGVASSYYDKPIAVLAGPGTVSNGDWETVRLQFHPMVRSFGKHTNGAFTSSEVTYLGNSDWYFSKATGSGYLIDGHIYLAHQSANIDEEVWLTQQGVIQGKDDVVEAAMNWINGTSIVNDNENIRTEYFLSQNYPNPFNSKTKINFVIQNSINHNDEFVTLKVYDILGREVKTLVNGKRKHGNYVVEFDADKLTSGIYFYRIQAGTFSQTKKLLLLK